MRSAFLPWVSPRQAVVLWAVLVLALAAAGAGAVPAVAQTVNPYGMNIHAPTGSDLATIMGRLQAAGIGWARIDMVWSSIETAPGVYDWSVYDALTASAKAHGVQLLAILEDTPAWATSGPATTGVPDGTAWVNFCTQAATRYAGSIQYWEMWNEPNLAQFWAGSMQQYIDQLLVLGANAIHAANPSAKVGGPALAHLDSADWYDWLDQVLKQAGSSLDFVTHHCYDTSGNRAVTAKLDESTVFGGVPGLWDVVTPSVREVLQDAGWFGKPFWLTETGWQSGGIGQAQQAAYYTGMLGDWFTGNGGQSWLTRISFYEIEDPPGGGTTWGILDSGGSPKQAYTAYQGFIASRTGPPPPGDDAHLVAANLPKTMDAGQTIDVSLTFQNTGSSTWTAANQYKLGAVGGSDPFAAPRELIPSGVTVRPGGQITFTFPFTAPAKPGVYDTTWQMLREGVAWFGDQATQAVTVDAAPTAAERTLPLIGGRFTVTVSWHDPTSGDAAFGEAVPLTDETGTFWFFSAANTELVVKMLDARSINGHFWFFYGALSNVEYWVTVKDQVRGTTAVYYNAPGNLCGQADTSTFGPGLPGAPGTAASPAGPAGAADKAAQGPFGVHGQWFEIDGPARELGAGATAASSTCSADATDLCLLGDRFRVSVTWQTPTGQTGSGGSATALSDETGTFSFFDPAAVDLVVKVLDGRSLTGKFWFFYGALTNVAYTITLTDTVAGTSKQYTNAQGNLCGLGDTNALN